MTTYQRFTVNGQVYDSLEAMPPDVRKQWDEMMALADRVRAETTGVRFGEGIGTPLSAAIDPIHPSRPGAWRSASPLQRIAICWSLLAIGLVVWTIFAGNGFLTSPAYVRLAVAPAAVVAIALTIILCTVETYRWAVNRRGGFVGTYILIPVLLVVLGCWAALWSVPSVLNAAVGTPYDEVYEIASTHPNSNRERCNRIYVRELKDFWFGRICVSNQASAAMKPGDHVRLSGKRSWFGIDVETYAN